jgi:hypothetical protein
VPSDGSDTQPNDPDGSSDTETAPVHDSDTGSTDEVSRHNVGMFESRPRKRASCHSPRTMLFLFPKGDCRILST